MPRRALIGTALCPAGLVCVQSCLGGVRAGGYFSGQSVVVLWSVYHVCDQSAFQWPICASLVVILTPPLVNLYLFVVISVQFLMVSLCLFSGLSGLLHWSAKQVWPSPESL